MRSNDQSRSLIMHFQAGAVSQTTIVTYAYQLPMKPAPAGLAGADRFFRLSAEQSGAPLTTFNRPVLINIALPADAVIIPGTAKLYWLNGSHWVTDGITLTYSSGEEVSAYLNHFSLFAVLGNTNRVYLPLIMKNFRSF